MARRAAYIAKQRSDAKNVLLVDAGNSIVGDKDPAKRTKGASSVELMNRMGYTAVALSLEELKQIGLDELRVRMREAQFALVSANAYLEGTDDLLCKPFVIQSLGGHQVGILGLTEAGSAGGVVALDPLDSAKRWLPEMQAKADIVILISHADLDVNKRLAEQVPGIDLLVSGQNAILEKPYLAEKTGTLVLHADIGRSGYAGEHIAVGRFSFDAQGRLLRRDWRKVALTGEDGEDAAIRDYVAELATTP